MTPEVERVLDEKPPCPACEAGRVHTDEEWLNHPYHPDERVDIRKAPEA